MKTLIITSLLYLFIVIGMAGITEAHCLYVTVETPYQRTMVVLVCGKPFRLAPLPYFGKIVMEKATHGFTWIPRFYKNFEAV